MSETRGVAHLQKRMRTLSQVKRFLASRRGTVALESATCHHSPGALPGRDVRDRPDHLRPATWSKRAAYRVARVNALALAAASDAASLETLVRQAITTEVGDWLKFDELMMNADCPQPQNNQQSEAEYCLSVTVHVYNSPVDMATTDDNPNGQRSQEDDAALGGGSGDMVVVRLRLQPRSVLGQIQQTMFGEAGLRAVAIMRNEERIEES